MIANPFSKFQGYWKFWKKHVLPCMLYVENFDTNTVNIVTPEEDKFLSKILQINNRKKRQKAYNTKYSQAATSKTRNTGTPEHGTPEHRNSIIPEHGTPEH